MSRDRAALIAGFVLLAALGSLVFTRLDVSTDITHFLPNGEASDDVLLARELASGELSRTLVLLIDAPDAATAARASSIFESELRADTEVADGTARLVGGSGAALEDELWRTYASRRTAFLAPSPGAARALLSDRALAAAAADLKSKLATPMSTMLAKVAPEDPLLIVPALFKRLLGDRSAGLKLVDGRFITDDERGAVLFLTTRASASDAASVRPLMHGIDRAFAAAQSKVGSEAAIALQTSGTHRFALAAEAAIRSDIQRVSIGSAIGLTTLFIVMFRGMRLLLLVLPILLSGFVAGTASCLALFGSVHGLTLAFGAALIGVSVDYAVHFHCHHLHAVAGRQHRDRLDQGQQDGAHAVAPRASLRAVWPGLLLGAVTTITGFLALVFSDLPGLRQLAVFAACGIAATAATTWLFLPGLQSSTIKATGAATALTRGLNALWFAPKRSRWLLATPVAAAILVATIGLPKLQWNDDLTELNRMDPTLMQQDEAVRARVVRFEQRRLLVATGADEEAALACNERIAACCAALREQGTLTGFRSIAAMLPSAATQRAVDAVVRSDQGLWTRLSEAFAAQGFVPTAFEPWRQHLAETPHPPLCSDELLHGPLKPMVVPFCFSWSGGPGFVTFLHELKDEAALRQRIADVPGARLIDIAGTLSDAYGTYRAKLLQYWLLGLGLVLLIVFMRHRKPRPTMIACAPALLAAACTAAILALCGIALNMLSLVALLMVVSMGVDYGVFLAEHRHDPRAREATTLAVVLAGLSTLLGFGLLSLSAQPPLFHIGLTSALGVLLCMLLAPAICALATPKPSNATP